MTIQRDKQCRQMNFLTVNKRKLNGEIGMQALFSSRKMGAAETSLSVSSAGVARSVYSSTFDAHALFDVRAGANRRG